MSYVINNSRGDVLAVVADGTINQSATSLALVGRAVSNYGGYENENYVYLLENFANDTAPNNAILGQLWYNSSTDVLSVYDSANAWVALASQDYVEAQKISPAFTGIPTAPTASPGTATTQIATTAFVTNSPQFSGVPTAPTASTATATTQIATTAFVTNSVSLGGVPTAPTAVAGTANTQIATTAFVSISPQFSGVPTAPTAAPGTANAQLATTSFVTTAVEGKETANTRPYGDNTTYIATTAFVQGEKASPTFTGVPLAPTASPGTANTQIATTAFVSSAVGSLGTMSTQNANAVAITGGTVSGISPIAVTSGGTGSGTAAGARTNLGLGTMSTQNASSVAITGGSIFNITDLAVADGGTGASSAAGARTNLGLGSISTQNASAVSITGGSISGTSLSTGSATITGGSISGITPLAVSDGGTGASTAAQARINLGIEGVLSGLGTMSAQNSNNVNITGGSISGLTPLPIASGGTAASSAGQARDNLGLGSMAIQNSTSVSISGGSISGISDLAVADGGTGASDAATALVNLGAVGTGRLVIAGAGLAGGGSLAGDVTLAIAGSSNGYGTRTISTGTPVGGSSGDIWYRVAS